MNTMLKLTVAITSGAFCLAGACPAAADGLPEPAQKHSQYTGMITAVDDEERTLSVKGFWIAKNFNAADNCKVTFENRPESSWADLRPGQKVEVRYANAHGVLVAHGIVQRDITLNGHITDIQPSQRTFTLKTGRTGRNFEIADACIVVLNDEKAGSLSDLEPGHSVSVVYERPDRDSYVARRIEQKSESFVGTIRAIDAGTQTVKAKGFLSEKKFNLADDCRIVIDGNPDGRLSDLRIGDRVEFSYEDADGVLVANRIGRERVEPQTETAQAAKADDQLR